MEITRESLDKPDQNTKFSDYFDYIDLLGQGAFASVVKAVEKSTNKEVAVKEVISKRQVTGDNFDRLRRESQILASMNHTNIVSLLDVKETDSKILIVMKLVKGGSLQQLMKERQKNNLWFSEQEASTIMRCLLSALEYIHDKNIVHRDFKPENILIDDPNNLESIKVADFGLSAEFGESNMKTLTQQCGTLIYMAPEQFVSKVYSKPIDIYSAGIIMYKLLCDGQHPFYESGDSTQVYLNKLKKHVLTIPDNIQLSDLSLTLLLRLLKQVPSERYSAGQALNHPWITGKQEQEIPLTIDEMYKGLEAQQRTVQFVKMMVFLTYLKKSYGVLKPPSDTYLRTCLFVDKERDVEKSYQVAKVAVLDKAYLEELKLGSLTVATQPIESNPTRTHLSTKYLQLGFVKTPNQMPRPPSRIAEVIQESSQGTTNQQQRQRTQSSQEERLPKLNNQYEFTTTQTEKDRLSPMLQRDNDEVLSPDPKKKGKRRKVKSRVSPGHPAKLQLNQEPDPIIIPKIENRQRRMSSVQYSPENKKFKLSRPQEVSQSAEKQMIRINDSTVLPSLIQYQPRQRPDNELNLSIRKLNPNTKRSYLNDRDQIKPYILDIGASLSNKHYIRGPYFPIHNYNLHIQPNITPPSFIQIELPKQQVQTNDFPPQKVIVYPPKSSLSDTERCKYYNFINSGLNKKNYQPV